MNEYPYWLDTIAPNPESASPDRAPSPPPRIPSSIDVLVIGAGYTGLATARRLARCGASVLVVERGGVGAGASSRNGGQVLTGMRLDPATLVATFGESRARDLFAAGNAAIEFLERVIAEEAIDCDYRRSGHVQAAWKPAHFEAFREEQSLLARVFGHTATLVPPADQRVEIGSDRYHGLLVDERSGGLNPARYVTGLAAAARRAGAEIATGVSVQTIQRRSMRWSVATTAGAVTATSVMLATNGYTDAALPALRRRLIPVGSYIIATERLGEAVARRLLPTGRMAFDSKHFLYYFRLTGDCRLLFGGRAEFTEPGPAATRRAAAILRDGMTTIFPELANVRVDYAWGGQVAFARDQLPHAGLIDDLFFAAGYGGHGIALATHLGDVMGRRIAEGPGSVSHPLLDLELPRIPLYDGTPWFLPLVGAYYRVKDWIS